MPPIFSSAFCRMICPTMDAFDFGARILPARQVGGDFYDVFPVTEIKMGVLIGDVADKGVPSAIFMAAHTCLDHGRGRHSAWTPAM